MLLTLNKEQINKNEIECSNCKAVYFGESKQSLKLLSDEYKRSVKNCDCENKDIATHCWEADHDSNRNQKEVVDRKTMLIPEKTEKPYIL